MREKRSALRTMGLNDKRRPWTILLDVLLDAGKRAVLALEEFPQKVRKSPKSFDLGLFLWCARRDLNPHVRSGH